MKTALLICMLIGTLSIQQDSFPDFTGLSLEGKTINLPGDTKGKYTLLSLAWSKKAQASLEGWYEPVYWKFIHKPDQKSPFAEDPYDVNVYLIIGFTGANQALYNEGTKEIKSKTEAQFHPHIITWKGDLSNVQKQLSLDKPEEPWFFLLDPEGKIVWKSNGAYTEEKMEQIESFLE